MTEEERKANLEYLDKYKDEIMFEQGTTYKQNYQRTIAKIEHLKAAGYRVIVRWEHQFMKFLKDNPEISVFPLVNLPVKHINSSVQIFQLFCRIFF